MLVRAFACVVVLATLMAPDLANASCSASDRPAGINPNTVAFYPTSSITIHVSWAAPSNLNIDLIIDDLTAGQPNINKGQPGGSVTAGLRGVTSYDVIHLTPAHNYRLTLSTRTVSDGCLTAKHVVVTATTPSVDDDAICTSYAITAEAQRAQMLLRGCPALGDRWNPDQNAHLQWCYAVRAAHQTGYVTEQQARQDAIGACHFNKLSAAFQTWMQSNNIQNATIADEIHSAGFGNRQADAAYPIASLSKAITATCIATLEEAGRLTYADKLDGRLRSFLTAHRPEDSRALQLTVAQLLRHTSGLSFDPVVPPWASNITNTAAADELFAAATLRTKLSPNPESYVYNNANYVLLGMIIKQTTGQSYEDYCKKAVLGAPVFSGVRIGAGVPAMGAFGGWEMSAKQYANFISANYRQMGQNREIFMRASYGVGYGLGVFIVATANGRHVDHGGQWPGGNPPAPPTTPQQFGSYFSLWDTGDLIVVLMDKWISDDQVKSLSAALRSSIGVK